MNRRKLLSFLGAAPAAAALPAVAEIPTPIPATTPILGQLMYQLEARMPYWYQMPLGAGVYPVEHFAISKIWDGEKWVYEHSQAGVDVKNKVLRS